MNHDEKNPTLSSILHNPTINILTKNFFIYGLLSLIWLLIRSGTKPSRLSYPCQRVAARNVEIWLTIYLFPVAFITRSRTRIIKHWKLIAVITIIAVSTIGYMNLNNNLNRENELNPEKLVTIKPTVATMEPHSDIFVVQDTDGSLDGVKALASLMSQNGINLFHSSKKESYSGPDGLLNTDDVVIIKVNSQWPERGGTNTDLVESLITLILEHPDGFKGEIIVADNGQAQYGGTGNGGSLDWPLSNSIDRSKSMQDVVDKFDNHKVSTYLWDTITTNVVQEFGDGDDEDGYVVSTTVVPSTQTLVTYPKFTTKYGSKISFKYGVYDTETQSYNDNKLKIINVPVLKTHSIYGVTGAVKSYMGVPSDKITASLGYRAHNSVDKGGMGTLMAQTRAPSLNILDAIWVNAKPGSGPRTPYNSALETKVIAASEDPVALDSWASKTILIQACENVYKTDMSSMNPENDVKGSFGDWLRLSMEELNNAGYSYTNDESKISIHLIK